MIQHKSTSLSSKCSLLRRTLSFVETLPHVFGGQWQALRGGFGEIF